MLTDERYKKLMEDAGMPDNHDLLRVLKKCAYEAALEEREACAKLAEWFEPEDKLSIVTYASKAIRNR